MTPRIQCLYGGPKPSAASLKKHKAGRFPDPPRLENSRRDANLAQARKVPDQAKAGTARHYPCLAKTRRFLPLISRFPNALKAMCRKELNIMGGLLADCKPENACRPANRSNRPLQAAETTRSRSFT